MSGRGLIVWAMLAVAMGVSSYASAQELPPAPDSEETDTPDEERDTSNEVDRGSDEGDRPTRERDDPTQLGGKKPHQMTEAELEEANFLWEPESEHPPSLGGALVAAFPGLILHGMGHYSPFVNNSPAGRILTRLELISLAFLGVGGAIYSINDRSSVSANVGLVSMQVGGALFSTSYFADVVGVSKGTHDSFPALSKRTNGILLGTGYTFLQAGDLPCSIPCHTFDAEIEAIFNSVTLRPYLRIAMAPFNDYDEFGLDMDWRLLPGQTPQEYGAIGLSLSQVTFGALNAQTDNLLPTGEENKSVLRLEFAARLSLELDVLLQHLQNVLMQTSLGIGLGLNSGERAAVPGDSRTAYVFLEQAFAFNLTPKWRLRPYYIYSEAEAVGQFVDWIGAFGTEVVWTPLDDWDVYIDGRGGAGAMVSSGVRYNVWD